jgi:type II secretory pathway pseudopilin PulG
MKKLKKKNLFSLIELLIVVTLLGALLGLILPMLSSKEIEAEEKVASKEMADIRTAFNKFYSDCVVTDDQLVDISEYGLWPLMTNTHPDETKTSLYEKYDYEKGKGWRGPYAEQEASKEIDPSGEAQALTPGSGIYVPVLKDPYGGYYRTIIPLDESSKKITLLCTGKNKTLETDENDKDSHGNIKAQGDDTVLQLLPCAP